MKVLYADAPGCDDITLKRLILLCDEIGFADKPSISYGLWCVGGQESPFRDVNDPDIPVKVSIHQPPSGFAEEFYSEFIRADLANGSFVRAFLDGLARDKAFAAMFLNMNAAYGEVIKAGKYYGDDIVAALVKDKSLLAAKLVEPPPVGFKHMYSIATHKQRVNALKYLLIDASTKVTSTLSVAGNTGLYPVSCNKYFSRLLTVRASAEGYTNTHPRSAPPLGLAVLQAVMPDEALQKLEVDDVLNFRLSTADAYKAWTTDLHRLGSRLEGVPIEKLETEVMKIFNADVAPRLHEYGNEMKSVRDRLFGNLIKSVVKFEVPTLSLAYVSSMSFAGSLAAVAVALAPSIPHFVDYFANRADVRRKNAMSYLINLQHVAGQR